MDIILLIFAHPDFTVFVSGCAGGLVKWVRFKEPFFTGLTSVLVGGVLAIFLAPLSFAIIASSLGRLLELEAYQSARLGGFISGAIGVALVGIVIDYFMSMLEKLKKKEPSNDGQTHQSYPLEPVISPSDMPFDEERKSQPLIQDNTTSKSDG